MSPNLEQQRLLEFALENLEFGDFQQRWEAAKTLSRLNPVAIQPLIQRLANPEMDSEVRWFIARILGNFDTDGVVAALVQVLRTSGTESQNPAAEGRGENFIDEDGDEAAVQQMAAVALASLGQRAIPSLVTLMFSQQLRPLVAQALSQIQQPEVIDPLIELTQDTDPAVRVIAIEALGNFQDQRIPSLLLSALNDPTSKVRKQAVVGLGVRPQLEGTLNLSQRLQPLLWDVQPEVCQQAQMALARLKTDAAAAALFEQLNTASVPLVLKVGAIRALGWLGNATALGYLQQTLKGLRDSCIDTFTKELADLPPLTSSPKESSGERFHDLEEQTHLCREIVQVVGRVQEESLQHQATEILLDFLTTAPMELTPQPTKQQIALGLGHLGCSQALSPLVQMLGDPHPGVRLHCVAALKQFAAPQQIYGYLQDYISQDFVDTKLQQGILVALDELSI